VEHVVEFRPVRKDLLETDLRPLREELRVADDGIDPGVEKVSLADAGRGAGISESVVTLSNVLLIFSIWAAKTSGVTRSIFVSRISGVAPPSLTMTR
jgi:hypothetical protein